MEIGEKAMATKKEKYDGISRPSNDLYRKNFNDIFKVNKDLLITEEKLKIREENREYLEEIKDKL
ncbi:MAG: hypothetical protein CMK80_00235 [Pseudomonadales bacterium]|nr:hypothetical protein [Pseudomonadales bacterium]